VSDPTRPHPGLRLEQDGPLLTLTLDDPAQRNAQTPSLWAALAEVGESLAPEVRVVIVRAEGPSFSAGLHRGMLTPQGVAGEQSVLELAASGEEALRAAIAGFQRGFAVWSQVPAVVLGAVQGAAIGAGFQLALACDLRVVADDVAFAMRETSLGMVPDLAGTAPLVRLVGYARALEICATGRWVGAAEAAAIGLATAAVPADDLDATVADLVDALLAAPEGALRETLALLRGAAGRTPDQQQAAERAAQARRLRALAAGTTGVVRGVSDTG
jgi:enoyl-CoA hydratase/carnithine racemase